MYSSVIKISCKNDINFIVERTGLRNQSHFVPHTTGSTYIYVRRNALTIGLRDDTVHERVNESSFKYYSSIEAWMSQIQSELP